MALEKTFPVHFLICYFLTIFPIFGNFLWHFDNFFLQNLSSELAFNHIKTYVVPQNYPNAGQSASVFAQMCFVLPVSFLTLFDQPLYNKTKGVTISLKNFKLK